MTASEDVTHDQSVDSSSYPSQLLTLEVLRRPVEFTQYTSIRYTERLEEFGAVPSIGSVGDSADNSLAETVNSLYKAELVYGSDQGLWRTVGDIELATLGWVHWFNNQRLHGYLDDIPPVEYEDIYHAERSTQLPVGNQ